MAIRSNNAEGGTSGATATIANSANSGTGFDSVTGAVTYGSGLRGSLAYKASAASIQYTQWSLTDTVINAKALFRFDSTPISNTPIRIGLSTSSITLIFLSDGRPQLYFSGASRSTSTSSNIPLANTTYRFAVWTDTTAGSMRASIYAVSDNSLLWDSGLVTGLTIAAPTSVQFGKYDTTTIGTTWDEVSAKSASDGAYENNPITDPLATPVVTLGAKSDPTTVGGNEGKQTVTWPAVTDAVSYEAWIATTSSPSQADFTLVATNVTSPYQFTGLTAGTKSYGIKAKIN